MRDQIRGSYSAATRFRWGGLLCGLVVWLALGGCDKQGGNWFPKSASTAFPGVDSQEIAVLLSSMTTAEKIGQLLVWNPVVSTPALQDSMLAAVRCGSIGGVFLRELTLDTYFARHDSLVAAARIPLFFGTDEGVSLHRLFTDAVVFPQAVTMACIDSAALRKTMESHLVSQCKALDINLVLTEDLLAAQWSPPYGPLPGAVGLKAGPSARTVAAFHREGIALVASLGETGEPDSVWRETLPGWKDRTDAGLSGLGMKAGSDVPPEDIFAGYRNAVGFDGLRVVDMRALEDKAPQLFLQGDLFLTDRPAQVYSTWRTMLSEGELPMEALDERVFRILQAKAWHWGGRLPLVVRETAGREQGLDAEPYVRLVGHKQGVAVAPRLVADKRARRILDPARREALGAYFRAEEWPYFAAGLFARSVVLVRDAGGRVPFQDLRQRSFRVLGFSETPFRHFGAAFMKYADPEEMHFTPVDSCWKGLEPGYLPGGIRPDEVVVVVMDATSFEGNDEVLTERINSLACQGSVVVVHFGSAAHLPLLDPSVAVIQAFERNETTEKYCAQILFGGDRPSGVLPVDLSGTLTRGTGLHPPPVRLGYTDPRDAGIRPEKLVGIHAVVSAAIGKGVFPACQVLVARHGKVVFSEGFGHHTYDRRRWPAVRTDDLFDIASITKVGATTLAMMRLVDTRQLDLSTRLGLYLPEAVRRPVGNIRLRDLMLHNSGLQAQMPIGKLYNYRQVPSKGCNNYFCRTRRGAYQVKIADGLYMRRDYRDSILRRVYRLPVYKPRFRYSDVNYFLLQQLVERESGLGLDEFLESELYGPLGLRHLTYHPLERFSKRRILPTEQDKRWRKTLVHGHVHDPAAALMGGVGGNAGLFSNAEDLAVLCQLLLNGGTYGGRSYFRPETVSQFTAASYGNHRGLGFDTPAQRKYPSYSRHAARNSYGHTGFTGTCFWVDPKEELIYIFLSNRVHPSAQNTKIFTEATRGRVHEIIYDALDTYHPALPEPPQESWEETAD